MMEGTNMVRTITLNGRKFRDRPAAFRYLKRRLSLPGYFGNNLDALHDCLTENGRPRMLILINPEKIVYYLGEYGEDLIRVLEDSGSENPNLQVVLVRKGKQD